jgi:hypothetical protein
LFLDLIKPPVHPSAPLSKLLVHPSAPLDLSKPPVHPNTPLDLNRELMA